jgi:hypothetical protein
MTTSTITIELPECEGCLNPMDLMGYVAGYSVCLACTTARHKAVVRKKCSCGKAKRPSDIKKNGSRTWISCLRCLGQIKQLS